jgi:hypothetical protein
MTILDPMWDRFRHIRFCTFISQSNSIPATGWSGSGRGVVTVEAPSPEVLLFRESGIWHPAAGGSLRFHNVYRWTRQQESVRLEHLRFGEEHPVYLFDLVPDSDGVWVSLTPHLCRQDTYAARLRQESDRLTLSWTVLGPVKEEAIEYTYAPVEEGLSPCTNSDV